ncbi:MAG: hypothetical protein HRU15_16525, partial [Planctomycetes bacterium]|nr:hypothetical protein [Planctomycetota bacterium]
DVSMRIDELLTDIQGGLGEYGGKTKAKALFYIAQGKYQIAQRNRFDLNRIDEVIRYYRRVLTSEPGPELRDAAKLGIARAALLAKDHEQAESQLKELLRDRGVSHRDRSYAGQLLGRHYREIGKFREAIEAFQGSSTE